MKVGTPVMEARGDGYGVMLTAPVIVGMGGAEPAGVGAMLKYDVGGKPK